MSSSMTSDRNSADLPTIQRQIHEKKTNILGSTRRMLGLVNESEVVAHGTATELVEQREKLENIERRCKDINASLAKTQRNLNRLGSIFGGVKNYFAPPKAAFPKSVSQPHISNANKKKGADPNQAAAAAVNRPTTSPANDNDTYLGKSRSAMDDLEREADDNLYELHSGVNRLKMAALRMNEELEGQKPLIDRVDRKFDVLNKRVRVQIKLTGKMLS